jgi:hypothetical protein
MPAIGGEDLAIVEAGALLVAGVIERRHHVFGDLGGFFDDG